MNDGGRPEPGAGRPHDPWTEAIGKTTGLANEKKRRNPVASTDHRTAVSGAVVAGRLRRTVVVGP